MSEIVYLIVSAAASVALGGIVITTLLAVNGLGYFGKTLAQADRRSEKSEPKLDPLAEDPIFCDDQALDRLAQYFDRP